MTNRISIAARLESTRPLGNGSRSNPLEIDVRDAGRLTADHPASSYGMPIYVDSDDVAHGPGDLAPGVVLRVTGGYPHTLAATKAADAGYPVAGWR